MTDSDTHMNGAKQLNVDRSLLTEAPVWTVVDSDGNARLYQERGDKKLMPGDSFVYEGEIFELSLTEPRDYPDTKGLIEGVAMFNVSSHEEYRFEPIADIRQDFADATTVALVS